MSTPTASLTKPGALKSLAQNVRRPMSRDKSDTLLLLGACSLVLAPHASHLPLWTTLACCALLLWRGWITFSGTRMPSRWLLLPVAVLAMASIYADYRTFFGRETGVAMLVLLIALKLLEMHAKRDLFVVIFLSFFLLLTNLFYSQSIGMALMIVAAVVAILTAQLSFQYTGVAPSLKRRLGLGAFIVALAAPLMLVLFILFPRIQGPLWGLPGDANAGRSGLSDSMAPGNISQLALSDDVAFRVKFIDPAPPQSKLYWRSIVLGNYDGRTWTQQAMRTLLTPPVGFKLRGTPIRHQVTLEPNGRRWLFALDIPQAAPVLADNSASMTPNFYLLTKQPINERVRYDAVSYVDFDMQPIEATAVIQESLRLPPGFNPETLVFGALLRKKFSDPARVADVALQYFREEKFSYTLKPPLLGKNAVDEFLFNTRAGFCEHYASAFVVLMRAAGIPARVVTGYQGGDMNTVDGYMTVRQSDAHAWAEIWVQDRGWIRVDPTAAVAPSRIEKNLTTLIPRRGVAGLGGLVNLTLSKDSWLSKVRFNWEAVTNSWNQWVLNYTPNKQKNLLRSLGFDNVDWQTLTALLFGIGGVVMALTTLPLILNRQKISPLQAVYGSLCQLMAKQGYARQPCEGPRTYGERLAAADSPLPAEKKIAAARFLALYESTLYARVSTLSSAATLIQLKLLLAKCR